MATRSDKIIYILVIDEIHELDKTGLMNILFLVISDSTFNLTATRTLKHWLDEGDYHCIGTTTPRHYGDIVQAFDSSSHLSDIEIAEP